MVPHGTRMATVEMKISFLERVHAGHIRVHALIIRKGTSLAVGEAGVMDMNGRLLAKSLITRSFSSRR
jgi:acyl-coenzyme A thioesterase PaaI-like protein